MKKRIAILGASAALALSALGVHTASADTGTTTVDVVVAAAGSLTISAPASATLTGATFNESLPSTASGSFGDIVVTDGRGLTSIGWSTTASSTNFVGMTDNTKSIPLSVANTLTFAAASVTVNPLAGGVGTALGGVLTAAGSPVAIASGTNAAIFGDVTYTWNPTASLVVPANTPAQTYRGTVTLTVA